MTGWVKTQRHRGAYRFGASLLLALLSGCFGTKPSTNPTKISGVSEVSTVSSTTKPLFTEMSKAAGIDFEIKIQGKRPLNIRQTIGQGCAFLDYDRDGNLDILLIGNRIALYHGDGKGHFTETTHEMGLDALKSEFLGCAVGDVDGDGYDDVYLSGYNAAALLKNNGGKHFTDITANSGLKPQPWGTSCAFAETRPGSGILDLYVANYVDFTPNTQPRLCKEQGKETSCGPRTYQPIPGKMYLNNGKGVFSEGTAQTGTTGAHGRGLGVAFADQNGKGHPTLAIANDETPGDLLVPQNSTNFAGKWQVKNMGDLSGTSTDRDGNVHGGMGIDWGDYDNDGKLDLFVATYQNETKCLYHNEGNDNFTDVSLSVGLGSFSMPYVAFGAKFFDYDNDGWLDVAVANGHVLDNVHDLYPKVNYRQPMLLIHNKGSKPVLFEDVTQSVGGEAFTHPMVGRGLATGDFDNDGRMDLLVVDSEGKVQLLHNEAPKDNHHFLGVKLVGTKSNRNGYGAMVTAELEGGRKLLRHCHADGSYLSSSDSRVHFGLGTATKVKTLTIRWSSGKVQTLNDVTADHYLTVEESK